MHINMKHCKAEASKLNTSEDYESIEKLKKARQIVENPKAIKLETQDNSGKHMKALEARRLGGSESLRPICTHVYMYGNVNI